MSFPNYYQYIEVKRIPHIEMGILTDLVTSTVSVTFDRVFGTVPLGRGNLYVYRPGTPDEDGIVGDQGVLFNGFEFTTDVNSDIDGFTMNIDAAEALSGVIVEYYFTL